MPEEKVAPRASQSEVPVPEIVHPKCPKCGADPLILKRLRHDFPDGVVVEILFCSNWLCRVAIGAQIVAVERPAARK